jgi:hypothetical protein
MATKGRPKGTAELTADLSIVCTPEMKEQVITAATAQGVNASVVVRWAVADWLAAHVNTTEVNG